MADAVGSVMKIVEVALKIKDAVDTVRQNRKDCRHIRNRVERVRQTLSLCESNAELMESPAVSAAVEELAEVLGKALKLVMDCQEETTAANAVCLCCTAGKLSKQLSKVDQGISNVNSEAMFAILVYHLSKQTQHGARLALTSETSEQTLESAQGGGGGGGGGGGVCFAEDITQGGARPPTSPEVEDEETLYGAWDDDNAASGEPYTLIFNRVREEKVSPNCSAKQRPSYGGNHEHERQQRLRRPFSAAAPDGETAGQPRNLLHQIAGVAFEIKAAVETVRRNKEDCAEIGRRANRISGLLLQLEDTETMKDAAVTGALEKLLETFRRAHTAVTACRRQSIVAVVCHCCSPGKLSDELRWVLDQMVFDLDVLIENWPSVPIARD